MQRIADEDRRRIGEPVEAEGGDGVLAERAFEQPRRSRRS
jgi:hypothetical protein